MPRYRVVAAVPSMLSLPNARITMNHLDDQYDAEATFTSLNIDRKNGPPEISGGAIAIIVTLTTPSIHQAVGWVEQMSNVILDQIAILTGTGIGDPLLLYALNIDTDTETVNREFIAWDLWNRAPTMHRPWESRTQELWDAWHEAITRIFTDPIQSKHGHRLVAAAHWYRVGLQAVRSADRFTAFWAALEALDASLLETASVWAKPDDIVMEFHPNGQRRSLRGIATLVKVVEGDEEYFRRLNRFRNDLLHANIVPPLANDEIQGNDARTMQWVIEGLQRILGLETDDPLIQFWRNTTEDFRVLGNVRIIVQGRFLKIPPRFLESPVEMVPISFSMTKHGQELLIQYDSRKGVMIELDNVNLWGPRQYLNTNGLMATLVDVGRRKPHANRKNGRRRH